MSGLPPKVHLVENEGFQTRCYKKDESHKDTISQGPKKTVVLARTIQ